MIHSEPAITTLTMNTPKARASALLTLSGPRRQVEEEREMHAHLRDGERREPHRNAGLVNEAGAARHPERGGG